MPHDAHQPVSPDELFFDRELSWLSFNGRVLEEARNPDTPLLERLKFLAIFSKNLDEFFMIHIPGLHDRANAPSAITVCGLEPITPMPQM